MSKIFIGTFNRSCWRSSVADNATTLLKLFLIDLAACVPLLENVERCASRWHVVRRLNRVPGPAQPTDEKDSDRNHYGEHKDHEQWAEDHHAVPSSSPIHHVWAVSKSAGLSRLLRPDQSRGQGSRSTRRGKDQFRAPLHRLIHC